jgi:hypothetical protein
VLPVWKHCLIIGTPPRWRRLRLSGTLHRFLVHGIPKLLKLFFCDAELRVTAVRASFVTVSIFFFLVSSMHGLHSTYGV